MTEETCMHAPFLKVNVFVVVVVVIYKYSIFEQLSFKEKFKKNTDRYNF